MEIIERIVSDDQVIDQVIAADHCQGFKWVSGGANSTVYGSVDHDYVVKVMSANDLGYLSWADVAWAFHEGLPYLPRILAVYHYMPEQCVGNPAREYSTECQFVFLIETLSRGQYRKRPVAAGRDIMHRSANWIDRVAKIVLRPETWSQYRPQHQDLFAALTLAREGAVFQDGCTADFDLHMHNVMLRGRQIVITDPLV